MDREGRYTPSFVWDKVKFLYRAEHKVEFEVRVKVRLWIQLHLHTANQLPDLHRDGSSKFAGSSIATTPR